MPAVPIRRRPRLIPALLVLTALLVLAACGGRGTPEAGTGSERADPGASGGGAAASCVAAVRYDDALYISVAASDVERGPALEGAEVPPCNDTGDVAAAPASPIDAFEIVGVDPRYAVTAGDGPSEMVYVREGYVPGMVDAEPLPPAVAEALGLGG